MNNFKLIVLSLFLSIKGMAVNIVRTNGFMAIYNGISAAMLRQVSFFTQVVNRLE